MYTLKNNKKRIKGKLKSYFILVSIRSFSFCISRSLWSSIWTSTGRFHYGMEVRKKIKNTQMENNDKYEIYNFNAITLYLITSKI